MFECILDGLTVLVYKDDLLQGQLIEHFNSKAAAEAYIKTIMGVQYGIERNYNIGAGIICLFSCDRIRK